MAYVGGKLMRLVTTTMGMLILIGGVFLITQEGLLFTQIVFPLGAIFIIVGIIECLSYKSYRGDEEEKSWVLIDGATTLSLGFIIFMNQITLEIVASKVFGLWVLIIGIRNFVRSIEHSRKAKEMEVDKPTGYYNHLVIGVLNFGVGLYSFFNPVLFNFHTMVLVGVCLIVEGINIVNVGISIVLRKIKFIQTKAERVTEAEDRAKKAHMKAKKALRDAERAKDELKLVSSIPEEFLDLTLRARPSLEDSKEAIRVQMREDKIQAKKMEQLKKQRENEKKAYELELEKIGKKEEKAKNSRARKLEEKRIMEEEIRRKEHQAKLDEARRLEEEKREVERLAIEAKILEEKKRKDAELEALKRQKEEERRLEEERIRLEKEKLEEERRRREAEREQAIALEQERLRLEQERLDEEKRLESERLEQERIRREEEVKRRREKLEEERRKYEEERRKEEERIKAEEEAIERERKAEILRLEEEHKKEQERLIKLARERERARRVEEVEQKKIKRAEDDRLKNELKRLEEERKAEEARVKEIIAVQEKEAEEKRRILQEQLDLQRAERAKKLQKENANFGKLFGKKVREEIERGGVYSEFKVVEDENSESSPEE